MQLQNAFGRDPGLVLFWVPFLANRGELLFIGKRAKGLF
jgi:hypothetical protein